jgi:hypothetical protein
MTRLTSVMFLTYIVVLKAVHPYIAAEVIYFVPTK